MARRKKKQPKRTRQPKRKLQPKRSVPPAARPIEINVFDEISVEEHVGATLSEEQRSFLKRVLEKVLFAIYNVEFVVEVLPDGTIRWKVGLRS